MKASKVEWKDVTYTHPETNQVVTVKMGTSDVKLVSLSDKPITRNNKNKTTWYPATGSWVDQKGVQRQPRVIVNGGNYAYGMETGLEYRTNLVYVPATEDKPATVLFIMSHLVRGEEADDSWFDFGGIDVALDLEKEVTGKTK